MPTKSKPKKKTAIKANKAKPKVKTIPKPTNAELKEWLKGTIELIKDGLSGGIDHAVEKVAIFDPAENIPKSKLFKFLCEAGVKKKDAQFIVDKRNEGWDMESISKQFDDYIISYSKFIKYIKLFADGNHEWERIVLDVEQRNFMASVSVTDAGWKTLRKAYDKGGYEGAHNTFNKMSQEHTNKVIAKATAKYKSTAKKKK